jgi:hypothetical protein
MAFINDNKVVKGVMVGSFTVDDQMSDTSTNPVQNKIAKAYSDHSVLELINDVRNELDSVLALIQ